MQLLIEAHSDLRFKAAETDLCVWFAFMVGNVLCVRSGVRSLNPKTNLKGAVTMGWSKTWEDNYLKSDENILNRQVKLQETAKPIDLSGERSDLNGKSKSCAAGR